MRGGKVSKDETTSEVYKVTKKCHIKKARQRGTESTNAKARRKVKPSGHVC